MAESIEVLRAESASAREEVYRLRYAVYVEERSKTFDHVDHERHRLTDDLDETATLFVARVRDTAVGTMRLNHLHDTPLPSAMASAFELDRFFAAVPPETVTSTSRFVVAPAWRTSTVGIELLLAAYRAGVQSGARFNLIHCAPGLIAYYERIGCRRFTKNFIRNETDLNVPMVMAVRDVDHLRRVGSPFLALAKAEEADDRDTAWLLREFPEAASYRIRRAISDDEFWSGLVAVGAQEGVSSSLFSGLSEEEISAFSRSAVVHRFRLGEEIIRDGGSGDEMYVLLQGMVDVIGSEQSREVVLRTLGPGDLVGEMALFNRSRRSATVVAATDVEALVLTHGALAQAARAAPELAARVLLNLGRILSERLQRMSRELTAARAGTIVS